MELKLYSCCRIYNQCSLLIVPYGIETYEIERMGLQAGMLLIVPYGIETREGRLERDAGIHF